MVVGVVVEEEGEVEEEVGRVRAGFLEGSFHILRLVVGGMVQLGCLCCIFHGDT